MAQAGKGLMRDGHRIRRVWTAALIAVTAMGCGSDAMLAPEPEGSEILDIVTSSRRYAPGDEGTVQVRNKSSDRVVIDVCPPEIDRWSGEMWVVAAEPNRQGCEGFFGLLEPGQSASSTFQIPAELGTGQYRFRFEQAFDENDELLPENERVSNVFEVAGGG